MMNKINKYRATEYYCFAVMCSLEAVPRLEAASKQIFSALVLVLDFSALALVLRAGAFALALSQDRDQDTNLQGKTQHSTQSTQVNHCNRPTDRKSKVHLEFHCWLSVHVLI